jgi:hypothetical protein
MAGHVPGDTAGRQPSGGDMQDGMGAATSDRDGGVTAAGSNTGAVTPLDTTTPFQRRASNVLLLYFVVSIVLFLLAVGLPDLSPAVAWIAGGVTLMMGVSALVISIALDRRHPWATEVAVIVLWLFVLTGIGRVVVELTRSSVTIPLEAIIAGWALSAAGRPPIRLPRPSLLPWSLVTVFVASAVGPPLLAVAATPGLTPLVVGTDALDLRLSATCPSSGEAWERIDVRVDWTWRARDLVTTGQDAVAVVVMNRPGDIGWHEWRDIENSEAATRTLDATPLLEERLASRGWAGHEPRWFVEADVAGQRHGSASAVVVPHEAMPARHGVLLFKALYAHGDHWIVEAEASCSW